MDNCYDNGPNGSNTVDMVRPNFRFAVEEIDYGVIPNHIAIINVSHPTFDVVPPAKVDARILRVEVETRGSGVPLEISNITLHNKYSPCIVKAKLYYTGNSEIFDTGTLIGEYIVDVFRRYSFDMPVPISIPEGKYNFWLTYDV